MPIRVSLLFVAPGGFKGKPKTESTFFLSFLGGRSSHTKGHIHENMGHENTGCTSAVKGAPCAGGLLRPRLLLFLLHEPHTSSVTRIPSFPFGELVRVRQ